MKASAVAEPISAPGGQTSAAPPWLALIWSWVAVQRTTALVLKTEPLGSDTFVAVRIRGLPSAPVPNVAVTVTPLAPLAKRDSLSLMVGAVALCANADVAVRHRAVASTTRRLDMGVTVQVRAAGSGTSRSCPDARSAGRR